VVRAAGLAAWGIIGGQMLLAPNAPVYRAWFVPAVVYILYLVFGFTFWVNTRRIQGRSPTRASVILLALQAAIGVLISSDLLLLVAMELPLVLTGRTAVRAMAALVIASACRLLSAVAGFGVFEPIPGLLYLPHGLVVVLSMIWLTVWEGLAFAGGLLAASQYRDAQELARVNAELLATQQLLADSSRLAERLHISRELHDAVGHHLAALSLNLELAALRASGQAQEAVREAQSVAKELLAEVRHMVSGLRKDQPFDLLGALETLVGGMSEPEVHLVVSDAALELPDPSQAHTVFRCVQEALTNTIRHAAARNIWIEIALVGPSLELRVRDDGRGARAPQPGNGLTGMRERFTGAGGGLDVDSTPGQGFSLHAWLPLPREVS
jgi:signal transduction histidine kinase